VGQNARLTNSGTNHFAQQHRSQSQGASEQSAQQQDPQ
jgi:hypothetical protein